MPQADRGSVWIVDLGMVAKVRPCLIVSVPLDPRDRVLVTRIAREPLPPRIATETVRRFVRDRRRVGLSAAELPVAASLATLYYGVAMAGAIATLIHPGLMRRHYRL